MFQLYFVKIIFVEQSEKQNAVKWKWYCTFLLKQTPWTMTPGDPYITGAWTAWVHLSMDFFQLIQPVIISSGSIPVDSTQGLNRKQYFPIPNLGFPTTYGKYCFQSAVGWIADEKVIAVKDTGEFSLHDGGFFARVKGKHLNLWDTWPSPAALHLFVFVYGRHIELVWSPG